MARRPNSWSRSELRALREFYPAHSQKECARRIGRTSKAVASRAKLLGLRRVRNYRTWTRGEIEDLRKLYPDTPTKQLADRLGRPIGMVYQKARKLGLEKSEAYLASPAACRLRRGDNVGAAYRFKKGDAPHNKGLRRPGWFAGRMRETQFKKGQRPHTWVPVGTIVKDAYGYLKMKVKDDPQSVAGIGGESTNWMYPHKMVWESAHGAVPSGHKVCFRDGNKENCSLENLVLLSNAERMKENSIHKMPAELKQVIILNGALKRRIGRLRSNGKESRIGLAEPSV